MRVIDRHIAAIIAVTTIGCGTVPSDRAGDPRLAQTTKLSAEQCIDRAMANPTADDESNYLIQPGDVLAIHFYFSPEFDDEVIVRPDGRITVRMAGEISAKGHTPAQLAEDLDRAYSRELTSPTATVHVKASPSRQIYVDGQVAHPGSFPMEPRMSTLQAIAVAGGLTNDAAPGSAVLIRRDACGLPAGTIFDVAGARSGAQPREDLAMLPGDIIYVPRSTIANIDLFVKQYVKDLIPVNPYLPIL